MSVINDQSMDYNFYKACLLEFFDLLVVFVLSKLVKTA